jgi:hypothetical protein
MMVVGGAAVGRYGDDVGDTPVPLRRRDAVARRRPVRVELRPR